MIGKHWKKKTPHRRRRKPVDDFASNSSSSSSEEDNSDDEFVNDGSYNILGCCSYIPMSKEIFFRPVVFSWESGKMLLLKVLFFLPTDRTVSFAVYIILN